MSTLARLKSAQGSDFALRFTLNVNSYIKIESHKNFFQCVSSLIMCLFMSFVLMRKKIAMGLYADLNWG